MENLHLLIDYLNTLLKLSEDGFHVDGRIEKVCNAIDKSLGL